MYCIDKDIGPDATLAFQLLNQSNDHFTIDLLTGIISLQIELDYETTSMHEFAVAYTDQAPPPIQYTSNN